MKKVFSEYSCRRWWNSICRWWRIGL